MVGEVEKLGEEAQSDIISLIAQGLSHSAIADEINKKYLSELTTHQITNFSNRSRNKSFQILKEEKGFQQKLAKQYFDTIDKMNTLHNEMWEFFFEIKKDPEYTSKQIHCPKCDHKFRVQLKNFGTFLKTAEHLLNQFKHVDQVLGRLKDKSLNITYNYVDLSKKLTSVMPQLFEKAEKQGFIKIKKKKLKQYFE